MTATLSHTCQRRAIAEEPASSGDPIQQILSELSNDLRELSEQTWPQQDFERFEREVHQRFVAAERAVLAGELQRLDVDLPEVTIGGHRHRRVLRSTETYLSAVGPITVLRTLYRAGSEQAVVAIELRAGIIAGYWTPLAARHASLLAAHLTPQECADTLRELGNMSPSKSSLDRLPKHLSSRWEEHREAFEESLRAETLTVPAAATALAVSLDGVMAPMKDGDRHAKRAAAQAEGRATKGPAGFREVGCGTVSCYDGDGERPGTLRMGRMPEANKATLKQMLSAEVEAALAQRPDLALVKLADGAHDNWSYLDELAPQAQSSQTLVDFFHAAAQLQDAVAVAYGENDARGRAQYEKHLHVLRHDHGGLERVIRALRYLRDKHPRRKRIRQVLGYFRRNRKRMDYARAAERGLPIGSGVVEEACKTLVPERMKRSGMRWRQAGGQAILTLRRWAQSDRFAAAWSLLSATYRGEISLPDEVEPAYGRAA